MAKVVDLEAEIGKILDKYEEEVKENLDEITKDIGKAGVRALKADSQNMFGGTGRYAKGWKSTVETSRVGTVVVLHNASVPGLPHLLEHGHAKRGGGRVPGRVHIKPIEEQLAAEFEAEVKAKL